LRTALEHRDDPELQARLRRAAAELNWERERHRLLGLYAALSS
jgi:hypothetical protein